MSLPLIILPHFGASRRNLLQRLHQWLLFCSLLATITKCNAQGKKFFASFCKKMGLRYFLSKIYRIIIIYWIIGTNAKNIIVVNNDDDGNLNVSSYNYYTLDRPRLLFPNPLIMHSLACKSFSSIFNEEYAT